MLSSGRLKEPELDTYSRLQDADQTQDRSVLACPESPGGEKWPFPKLSDLYVSRGIEAVTVNDDPG